MARELELVEAEREAAEARFSEQASLIEKENDKAALNRPAIINRTISMNKHKRRSHVNVVPKSSGGVNTKARSQNRNRSASIGITIKRKASNNRRII